MKNNSVLDIYKSIKDLDIEYFSSQDYFVHQLRFNKMIEKLSGKNIIDLGCGRCVNLLKAIVQSERGANFESYVAIDYGNIQEYRPNYAPVANKVAYFPYFDFTDEQCFTDITQFLHESYTLDDKLYITCFEVLEHMDFESQKKFLYNLSRLMHDKELNIVVCYFSTPNYNGKAAKNHISEINYLLEEEMFNYFGLDIVDFLPLSAHLRFINMETIQQADISLNTVDKLRDYLPAPLFKIAMAPFIHRQYSNNIMYTLAPSLNDIDNIDLNHKFKYEEERQK